MAYTEVSKTSANSMRVQVSPRALKKEDIMKLYTGKTTGLLFGILLSNYNCVFNFAQYYCNIDFENSPKHSQYCHCDECDGSISDYVDS